MLLIVFFLQLFGSALSEVPLAPPQNINVNNWLMTWTPAAEGSNVSYTVQYSRFDSDAWINVPACVRITSNSCNVASTKEDDKDGCVKLRLHAETPGLNSTAVEACSQHGHPCAPEARLVARPGSLTVHLSRDNHLVDEYQDHITHRAFYGKDGEPLEAYEDDVSSVVIKGLEEGQRYCARVQFMKWGKPTGLPSCTQCELIPETKSRGELKAEVIAGVAIVSAIFFSLALVTSYFLFYHCDRIKRFMRPPCEIPTHFLLDPRPGSSPPVRPEEEERCELLSVVSPQQQQQQQQQQQRRQQQQQQQQQQQRQPPPSFL